MFTDPTFASLLQLLQRTCKKRSETSRRFSRTGPRQTKHCRTVIDRIRTYIPPTQTQKLHLPAILLLRRENPNQTYTQTASKQTENHGSIKLHRLHSPAAAEAFASQRQRAREHHLSTQQKQKRSGANQTSAAHSFEHCAYPRFKIKRRACCY
jgi:hypothetical protein